MNQSQRKADLKKTFWQDSGGYPDKFIDALIEVIVELEQKVEDLEKASKPVTTEKKDSKNDHIRPKTAERKHKES